MEHVRLNRPAGRLEAASSVVDQAQVATTDKIVGYALGGLRLGLGFIFFWAFLDKVFGLGYSTPPERAWINGGNPTLGYLSSATGPLAGFFHSIAGATLTNLLFMGGLLGVGASLILGMGVRVGGFGGALMVLLMYASHPPMFSATPPTNPIVDDHIAYAFALVILGLVDSGRTLGLGNWWSRRALVRRYPALQ